MTPRRRTTARRPSRPPRRRPSAIGTRIAKIKRLAKSRRLAKIKTENYTRSLRKSLLYTKKIKFASPVRPDRSGSRFDSALWERDVKKGEAVLRMRAKDSSGKPVSPAKAIRAILQKPGDWSLDCAAFVQVSQLNAILARLGPKRFDEYMKEASAKTHNSILLRAHASTGVLTRHGWSYQMKNPNDDLYSKSDQFKRMSIGPDSKLVSKVERKTPEQIANAAPIGSEVTFHNLKAAFDSPYRFENTIKIGRDRYLAFPLSRSKALSGAAIRSKLVKAVSGSSLSDVRINTVEIFDLP